MRHFKDTIMDVSIGDLVSFSPDLHSGADGEYIGLLKSVDLTNCTIEVLYRVVWRSDGTYTLRKYAPSTDSVNMTIDVSRGFISKTSEEFISRFRLIIEGD